MPPLRRVLSPLAVATALAAAVVSGPTGAPAAAPAADQSAPTEHRGIRSELEGVFTFTGCPAGSAPGDLCLDDLVTGRLDGLGRVRGSFAVVIHSGRADGDCAPITKRGTFTTDRGDGVEIVATGTYCSTPAIAAYVITSARGTGRLAGRAGTGSWVVPAPTALGDTGGRGPETVVVTLDAAPDGPR